MTPRPGPTPVSAEEREAVWQRLVRYLETKRRQLDQQLPREIVFDDRFRAVLALLTGDDAVDPPTESRSEGCPMTDPLPSSPPASRWTIAQAQAALSGAAAQLLAVFDLLATVHRHLPLPPDLDARHQGRLPYDQATDILGTIECVQDDCLRPAIASLKRSSRITDAELNTVFRTQK